MNPEWLKIVRELSQVQDQAGVIPRFHDHRTPGYNRLFSGQDPLGSSHIEFWRTWEYGYHYFNLEIADGMSVCDVGCGNSPLLAWLKSRHQCTVLGVETLDAHQNSDGSGGGNYMPGRSCHPQYSKIFGVPYLDVEGGVLNEEKIQPHLGTFDRVVCIGVMEHIDHAQVQQFVRNIQRLCKAGGLIGITYDIRLDEDIARGNELVEQAGLTIVNPDYGYPGDTMPFCKTIRGMILRKT